MAHDMKNKHWTDKEIAQLKKLAAPRKLFAKEIAQKIGRPATATRWKLNQLGIDFIPRDRMGRWNAKHAHLREAVFRYFLNHTREECEVKFGLTPSELQSCFTVGYRDPKLAHLRKETRRQDHWSIDETLFMLRHSGLRERKWIAKKLKRGGMHAIKEHSRRLNQGVKKRGLFTKQMHGLPRKIVEERLGIDGLKSIVTKAGPVNPEQSYRYIIVPWVTLAAFFKAHPHFPVAEEFRSGVRAMARFQMWIYGTRSERWTVRKIKQATRGRL